MHSPRELADLKDVKATLDLLGRFLCTPPSAEVKTASVQKKEHPCRPAGMPYGKKIFLRKERQ